MGNKHIKSGGKKVKSAKKPVAKKAAKKITSKNSNKTTQKKSKPASSQSKSKPKKSVTPSKKDNRAKIISVKKTEHKNKPAGKTKTETRKKPETKNSNTPTKKTLLQIPVKSSSSPNNNQKISQKTLPVKNQNQLASSKTTKKSPSQVDTTGKLPANAFELEYVVHASAELLFTFLTEPSGLSEWFCDDVNIRNGLYTFFWEGSQQQAREVKVIPDKLLRLQWLEKSDDTYFEYRIEKDDLTSDISLIITDFADSLEEKQSSILLWNSQIDKLLHVMGAYF